MSYYYFYAYVKAVTKNMGNMHSAKVTSKSSLTFRFFNLYWFWRMSFWYTHKTSGFKTSGFKTSGFKTSETSGLQNVRFTKRQLYKTSGLQNVRFTKGQVFKTSGCKKTSIYILYLWLVEIRRSCCLFSSLEVFLLYITIMASNK